MKAILFISIDFYFRCIPVERQGNRGSLKARPAKVPLTSQPRRPAAGRVALSAANSSSLSAAPAVPVAHHGSLTNLWHSKRSAPPALRLQSVRSGSELSGSGSAGLTLASADDDALTALSTTRTETETERESERATELQASERSATTCPTNCRSLGALIAERSRAPPNARPVPVVAQRVLATGEGSRASRLSELNAALERDLADLARSVHVQSQSSPTQTQTHMQMQSARTIDSESATSTSASASSTAASASQRSLPVAQLAPSLTTNNVDVLRTICTAAARLKRSSDALLARPAHPDDTQTVTQRTTRTDESALDLVAAMHDLRLVECNLSELERVSTQRSSERAACPHTDRSGPGPGPGRGSGSTSATGVHAESARVVSPRSASPDSSDSSTY